MAAATGTGVGIAELQLSRQNRPGMMPSTGPLPPDALDVTRVGARGDGRTDDTDAFRSALRQSPAVSVPAGTYRLSTEGDGAVLELDRPGMRLTMARGAVLRLEPTGTSASAIIAVTAPDVTVEGGVLIGDLSTPQQRSGEWGHGVVLGRGAHRASLSSVTAMRCWGDGFYITGAPADVVLAGCAADGNRRQGLSIVDAVRPLVLGGRFVNTGYWGQTAPSAGIDVEPNRAMGQAVVGASLRGVTLEGNRGPGLLVVGTGGAATVHIQNAHSKANAGNGFTVIGAHATVAMDQCVAESNHTGFVVDRTAAETRVVGSRARLNSSEGFLISGPRTTLENCEATKNASSGILVAATAVGSVLQGCACSGNSVGGPSAPEVDVWASDTKLVGLTVTEPPRGRASFGIALRASAAGTVVISSPAPSGFPPGRAVSDSRPGPVTP